MARSGAFKANLFLTGFERNDPFPSRLRRLKKIKDRKNVLYKAMAKAAEDMRGDMEGKSPVLTGLLSQSFAIRRLKKTPTFVFGIRVGAISGPRVVQPNQLGYISGIAAGEEYNAMGWRDHWAELGTRHHPPHPHVGPAIKKNLGSYNRKLRFALGNIFGTKFYAKLPKS
jgi:hypothetical protein